MDIEKLKAQLIHEIEKSDDLELLLYLKASMGISDCSNESYQFDGMNLGILSEPEMSMEGLNKTTSDNPLTDEQRERLMQELEESEEDIKHGRVYTNDEVKAYFKIKMDLIKD